MCLNTCGLAPAIVIGSKVGSMARRLDHGRACAQEIVEYAHW
jgi:hypothetical protein